MSREGEWVALEVADLGLGQTRPLDVDGHAILLCNVRGEYYAVANRCTHAKVELTFAALLDCELECPVHGARFDVRDGAVKSRPARRALRTYPLERTPEGIEIRLDASD